MDRGDMVSNYLLSSVKGRRVTAEQLEVFYENLSSDFTVDLLGRSVLQRAIRVVRYGSGPIKILMWSQMHGNESTTTKAVLGLFNFLNTQTGEARRFKEAFQLVVVPVLNPDGAAAYTRVNANGVDLNRDAILLTQPESILLRQLFDEIKPHWAFNLHDQRTIFAAGSRAVPATLSFLAPSFDLERGINDTRRAAMQLIAAVNKELQQLIPNQVARFDDGFNLNCIGDYMQYRGVPTVLFEAGHFPGDYQREKSAQLVLFAMFTALDAILSDNLDEFAVSHYLAIPENEQRFRDLYFDNVRDKDGKQLRLWAQFVEVLRAEEVVFEAVIVAVGADFEYYAHQTISDACLLTVNSSLEKDLIDKKLTDVLDFKVLTVNDLLKK